MMTLAGNSHLTPSYATNTTVSFFHNFSESQRVAEILYAIFTLYVYTNKI